MITLHAPMFDRQTFIESVFHHDNNSYSDSLDAQEKETWEKAMFYLTSGLADMAFFTTDEPTVKDGISRNSEYIITRSSRDCKLQLTAFFVKKDSEGNLIFLDPSYHANINTWKDISKEKRGYNLTIRFYTMDEVNNYFEF